MANWTDLSGAFGYGTKLTSAQMQQLRDNITAAFEKAASAPVLADNYIVNAMMGDNAIGQAEMADSAIGQAELNADDAESSYDILALGVHDFDPPGGLYGFVGIKVKGETAEVKINGFADENITTSYAYAQFRMENTHGTLARMAYIQQKYITSSGEVFWYMIMRDKVTKKIMGQWCCSDHPCMPQNKDPEDYPHPWQHIFDESQHEIVVVNPDKDELENIRLLRANGDRTPLEVIEQEYDIDETTEPDWIAIPITIGLPPDWQEKKIGDKIKPIKKVIPKPDYVKTAKLKLKV